MEDIKITIKTGSDPDNTAIQYAPVAAQIPQAVTQMLEKPQTESPTSSTPTANADDHSKYITIKSPIIGTFYRKPAPDKPLFVEVGQTIAEGDVLCIIEAMKLFNEIESEVSGKVVKILVDDSSPVEFDQPLFLVDPS